MTRKSPIGQLSSTSEAPAESAEIDQPLLTSAEVEERAAQEAEKLRAQLAELELVAQNAAAEVARLEQEAATARSRAAALSDRGNQVLAQAVTAQARELLTRGTPAEAAALTEREQLRAEHRTLCEQHAAATRRAHELAAELVIARDAKTAADLALTQGRADLDAVIAELDRLAREAHAQRGLAELEHIVVQIGEEERAVTEAKEALAAREAVLNATRRSVSGRMGEWPTLRDRYEEYLPRIATRAEEYFIAWIAWLKELERLAGGDMPHLGASPITTMMFNVPPVVLEGTIISRESGEILRSGWIAPAEHRLQLLRQRKRA